MTPALPGNVNLKMPMPTELNLMASGRDAGRLQSNCPDPRPWPRWAVAAACKRPPAGPRVRQLPAGDVNFNMKLSLECGANPRLSPLARARRQQAAGSGGI
jgi:hypothetical protein